MSRKPGTGGLANLNSDLTAFLGEGWNKRPGAEPQVWGRPTASQWDTPTLALRRDAATRGSLLSQAGASGDDLTGEVTTCEKRSLSEQYAGSASMSGACSRLSFSTRRRGPGPGAEASAPLHPSPGGGGDWASLRGELGYTPPQAGCEALMVLGDASGPQRRPPLRPVRSCVTVLP